MQMSSHLALRLQLRLTSPGCSVLLRAAAEAADYYQGLAYQGTPPPPPVQKKDNDCTVYLLLSSL